MSRTKSAAKQQFVSNYWGQRPQFYPGMDHRLRTGLFTVLALLAFASNSVLCRLALGHAAIDAASFTTIRLLAGAATLWMVASFFTRADPTPSRGSWGSGAALFLYAAGFSFAYLSLSAEPARSCSSVRCRPR